MNFEVGIGNSHIKKPDGNGIVSSKIAAVNNYNQIALEDIADMVGNRGYSLVPHKLAGGMKQQNFVHGQLFLLDFDGSEKDQKKNITFEAVLQRAESNNLNISFAYKTLSCPDEKKFFKFRICFVFEQVVTDIIVANYIYKALARIFPECDTSCAEVSRMFLGGKELFYLNPEARFNIMQLNHSLYKCLGTGGNFNRNLNSFMKSHDIEVINGLVAIGNLKDISAFDEKGDLPNKIILGDGSISSIFYIKKSKGMSKDSLHRKRTSVRKPRISIDNHSKVCMLLEDFKAGIELSHNERFILRTNLNYISGGNEFFYELLRSYYDISTVNKWLADEKTLHKYLPVSCSTECRYYEECHKQSPFKNLLLKMLNDKSVWIENKQDYVDIDTATVQLTDNLNKAFNSKETGFHLIKAQTALGKTTQIVNLVNKNVDKTFLIAEPLNKLKMEVYNSLKNNCDSVIYTASVRDCPYIPQDIKELYMKSHQNGMHHQAKNVVKDYVEEFKEQYPDSTAAILELERIMDGIAGCTDSRVVITTHAMLMNMTGEQLSGYDAVIIDEDILYLQLLNNTKSISKSCIESIASNGSSEYSQIARRMLSAKEGHYYKASWYYPHIKDYENDGYNQDYSDDYYDYSSCVDSDDNINDLKTAGSYVLENEVFHYLCITKLPEMKYIVLTATYNEDIYKAYFSESNIISYPCSMVKYRGRLVQYTYHSLGRGNLSKKQYIYDFIDNQIGDVSIISFLSEEKNKNLNDKEIHFGNAVGVNCFKGKDLAIIGTPYKNNKAYLLPCCYLYGSECINGDAKRHSQKRIRYKGKSFLITTFSNEMLKNFQMYSLESELEQCIGRSRLLRCNCTVYLFSAFPCEQAELITENYLLEYENAREDQSTSDPLAV